jgi:hypothetical protein
MVKEDARITATARKRVPFFISLSFHDFGHGFISRNRLERSYNALQPLST